ncbi:MAG: hypothetical protein KKE02_07320 [Alphaproteobacteria bacterium]|nr:hypothetical protein [Alphaproteobacteria bacterium]MBU1515574.1 hypothetical protein [Alphaproteobacteria bacterium]MBU2095572.1 hypothetical protein [Alphaproteobacteria bacterium]MBU2150813.1 hypothetical protein [Alphaproteobacteria bacterium]MBU2307078.1 hypothetical protein [Alphaproteobacteria bacterium]
MSQLLIVGTLAAALLGGGHTGGRADRDGLTWSRDDAPDRTARLVLAGPEADSVRLVLECTPGAGGVDVIVRGLRDDGAVVELHSGKTWNRYPGVGAPDDAVDGVFNIRVRLSAADPVLARLADTGQLRVVLGERRIHAPNSFAPAHDFLKVCAR